MPQVQYGVATFSCALTVVKKQKVTLLFLSAPGQSCENADRMRISQLYRATREGIIAMNDNDEQAVTIIIGRVRRSKSGAWDTVHVMLTAPDDDSAVRKTLDALASEGYAEAELDQIGDMEGEPDEEPHISAYQGALEGEVAIVVVSEGG